METSFDYVIIGGGSAGCVLANRLSADGRYTVCLLEAGPCDSSFLFRVPGAFPVFMFSKKYNWAYQAVSDPAIRKGQLLFVPRGKCLGGCSSTNAMAYVRGQREDFDGWAAQGNVGWDYDAMMSCFQRVETTMEPGGECNGGSGPIRIEQFPLSYPVSQRFLDAAQSLGYPLNRDFNGDSQEGVGVYAYTIDKGVRASTSRAYLRPALERENLTVLTETQVQSLVIENRLATGCDVVCGSEKLRITARREIILSAGAINSPQLLLLSGIGDADDLKRLGISCIHHLPGVGRNLQEHVDACVLVESKKNDGLTTSPGGLARLLPELIRYLRCRKGKLASPLIEVGGFIRSTDEVERPDIQLGLVPVLFDDNGRDLKLMSRPGYSCHVCVLRPESRGQVRLRSADPGDAPVIDFNFFKARRDRDTLVQGIRRVREILEAPAFDSHRGAEIQPGPHAESDDEILRKSLDKLGTVFHPVGTCKMGVDADAVVDPELRVQGIDRLRVVDASIMPTITSGNTNAPTIAIAERASELILGEAG